MEDALAPSGEGVKRETSIESIVEEEERSKREERKCLCPASHQPNRRSFILIRRSMPHISCCEGSQTSCHSV